MLRRTCCVVVFLLHVIPLWSVPTEDHTDVKTNVCNMTLTSEGEPASGQRQVQCTCDQVSAVCSDLGLTELPALISFPKNILRATFSGNHIVNIGDDTFYSGREVIEMDLSHNRIDFLSVLAFAPFKKLQRLTLSHNRLYHVPARSFEGLNVLKALDLSFNEIGQLFYHAFEKLSSVEELKLKGNPLHEIEPQHLSHLINLKFLDLDAIMLAEVPDHLFVYASKLKFLTLANNLLTNVPNAALKNLKSLRHLDLSGNPIETIEPQAFLGLENLQDLYLDRMPELKEIQGFAFGDLRRLRELHCSYNFRLSALDSNAFVEKSTGDLVMLEQLFLRENNLQRLPADLLRWSKSMELELRGNPWDCHCDVQWMMHVKTKTDFQRQIICKSPTSLQGKRLSNLKIEELPCGLSILEVAFLSALCLLAVSLCFALIGFLLHRRRHRSGTEPYYKVSRKTGVDEVEYVRGFDL